MYSLAPALTSYLSTLSDDQHNRYRVLLNSTSDIFNALAIRKELPPEQRQTLTELIFMPEGEHPHFDDMSPVFFKAFEELALRTPRLSQEIPVAFIGYHALNRLSRNRQSLGFLLTDQTLYVQDDYSALFEQPPAQIFPLPKELEDVSCFLQPIVARYRWDGELLNSPITDEIKPILTSLLTAVLNHHRDYDSLVESTPEHVSLDALFQLLNLRKVIQDSRDSKQQKPLTKVAKKFAIPADESILYAVTTSGLFGGPYGFAVTATALYSRDLFEQPERIELSTFTQNGHFQLTSDKKNIQTAANQLIFLPAHLDLLQKENLLQLLQGTIELSRAGRLLMDDIQV